MTDDTDASVSATDLATSVRKTAVTLARVPFDWFGRRRRLTQLILWAVVTPIVGTDDDPLSTVLGVAIPSRLTDRLLVVVIGAVVAQTVIQAWGFVRARKEIRTVSETLVPDGGSTRDRPATSGGFAIGGFIIGGALGSAYGLSGAFSGAFLGAILGDMLEEWTISRALRHARTPEE